MRAHPVVFEAAGGSCLGWFHRAEGGGRRVAVVLCRPLGYEALCSYRAYTQLAHALAASGFDVLRFDYHGCGDSAGGDTDPARVEAWLASIAEAVREARRLADTEEVALFGMRLGATLAMEAAQRMGGVRSLALWAPCASGRAFVREMRAAFSSHAQGSQLDGGIEALGTLFTPETLAGIEQLAPDRAERAPAQRVLIAARDDMPGEGPLPARLRALGAEVATTAWPGYADMMSEPHDAKLAPEALRTFVDWLAAVHPAFETAGREQRQAIWPSGWTAGNVAEVPVAFGERRDLFGVLSQLSAGSHAETAVLLLNVGGNYRVGPNRVYVKLARELASSGYRVLRMDVSGIGDSRIDEDITNDSMYRSDAVGDVGAAIDMLRGQGCKRFLLLGICSGAYLAFQTALQDERVDGQMIVNARLLEWDEEKSGPWQTSMQQFYKSTRYYKQKLKDGRVYARLLRGEIDVVGIGKRFVALGLARARRAIDAALGRAPRAGVLPKMKHLSHRGVRTLVAMSAEDDGLDYIEFHLGERGARMHGQPNFRMELIEESDHTFSTTTSQRALIDAVKRHLDTIHWPAKLVGDEAANDNAIDPGLALTSGRR